MTPQIALVLFILAVAIVFLISEWLPLEVTALLVLGILAMTGLVSPGEALSGFSNPAVVTVWAVFILSGGLTRTGVGNLLGSRLLRLAGKSETMMVIIIMVCAGLLSAFMNNVAVAALLLPVVMDIARSTGMAPSGLLMPLAYGSLLGGLITQIGTPPNILVSEELRKAGLTPFSLFDFTPVGGLVFVVGVAFMALIGRRLLPRRNMAKEPSPRSSADLGLSYRLQERVFSIHVPPGSALANRSLAESRLGSALGLNVIAIKRRDKTLLAPKPSQKLQENDRLIVKGKLDSFERVKSWQRLTVEKDRIDIASAFSKDINLAEVVLPKGSEFVGKTLSEIDFRNRFDAMVLAIRRGGVVRRTNLQDEPLAEQDALLLQGKPQQLEALAGSSEFEAFRPVTRIDLTDVYHLQERLLLMAVPGDSALIGHTLKESRLGDALGIRVLCIARSDGTVRMPDPEESIKEDDRLVVEARMEGIDILHALEQLKVDRTSTPDLSKLVSETVGLVETVLSPYSRLAGKTLRNIHFREKYGLSVLAVWRQGKAHHSDLRDMTLNFGDALLLYGERAMLNILGREPDFIVLTESAQEVPRQEKAKLAAVIMVVTFVPVIAGLIPIYIAAVVGAALMVMGRCLTMEEAYRYIEWKAVFLIAGMFPLGTALDQSGAAKYLAEGMVSLVGPFGPIAVMLGLLLLTFLATCFIPTAALVVLMAPVVLNTATQMSVSQHALMMAMAVAASASFTTPISHPANILVMGPGGYRFIDYLKVGGLLTLVTLLVVMAALPFFWPLNP
jgi:di/tricarboxylate transporter